MSVISVDTALRAKVLALSDIDTVSSYSTVKRDSISTGSVLAIILPVVIGQYIESNNNYHLVQWSITIAKKLSAKTAAAEATYVQGEMLTIQQALLARTFYSTISGVYEVESQPEIEPATRVGNVIEFNLEVQASVNA